MKTALSMRKKIDVDLLRKYLADLTEEDFQCPGGHALQNPDGVIRRAFLQNETDTVSARKYPNQAVGYGTYILCDFLGNDLSIVKYTKRLFRYKGKGLVNAKFCETIISDCRSQYGTPLNGCWLIPERFFINRQHESNNPNHF